MSKIGLTIAAGLVITTGLWGMTHLAALQDAVGESGVTAIDAVAGDAATSDETVVELSGQTETSDPVVGEEVSANEISGVASNPAPILGGSMGLGLSGGGVSDSAVTSAAKSRPLLGAAAEFSRRSERDAEQKLNEFMQTRVTGNLSFPGEIPLVKILEELSRSMNESQENTKLLVPDIATLEEESIILFDVMIKDIEIPKGLMTFGSALDHILSQTDPELTWTAKGELLLITTTSAAESEENLFLRGYDISRLRAIAQLTASGMGGGGGQSAGGGGGGFFLAPEPQFGGGSTPAKPQAEKTSSSSTFPKQSTEEESNNHSSVSWETGLISTIVDLTSPQCSWYDIDGEGGKLSLAGNRLLVRQSRRGHEQVVAVLEQLELAAEDATNEQ